MPAPRADEEHSGIFIERISLAGGWIAEGDGAANRVAQIELPVQQVLPRGRGRILKVRHEHLGTTIERVDDHLAVYRSSNFYATIKQVGGQGSDRPLGIADVRGFRQKVRPLACV